MSQHFTPHIIFGANPIWFATVLLCVTYAVIIWDRVNRAIIALVAAGIVDPMPGTRSGETVYPEAPAEVVGLPWRPPGAEHADTRHRTLVAIGERFAVRTASRPRVPLPRHPIGRCRRERTGRRGWNGGG